MALTSRRLGAAALVALLGAAGLAANASATVAFKLTRVAGSDRYATASAVAADAFATGSQTVVLARGDQFADALAGAYLAGLQTAGAPVLLTTTATVPAATKSRLTAMGAKNVILLGGTSAISTAAEDDLKKTYTVTRVAGANRYDTAAKVGQTPSTLGVGSLGGQKTAIVASGETFADALAAGPLSYAQRFPIILTQAGALPAESKAALTALGIKHAVIVGGTNAVSAAVDAEVKAAGVTTTERVSGTSRYATATALADFAIAKVPGWSTTAADLATGASFADALAGGPAAGKSSRSIVLTEPTVLSTPTSTWLQSHASTLAAGRVLGGTSAVTEAVRTGAEQAGGASTTASGGQVTSVDTANNRYTYVPGGASAATTVSYAATDLFTVNGAPADMGGFEANITPADTITYTTGAPAKHDLVNVDASKITSGVIGNIDTTPTAQTLAFINAVNGEAVRSGVAYAGTGFTYVIDGKAATSDVSKFEAEVSEGDSLAISGTVFTLTNTAVQGPAQAINKQAPVRTQLRVGVFGDDPSSNVDDLFSAGPGDAFSIPGTTATDYATFNTHLTVGDTITYTRVGGTETYTLVDQAPTNQTGQAAGAVNKNADLNPLNDSADGGSFTLATATGSSVITYVADGVFMVNGNVSSEGVFENNYSAGDTIVFRAGDTLSGTSQRLELTDANLSGAVKASTINTTDGPTGNTYEVLAQNGITTLATISYADGADLYKVNGADAVLADFETQLSAIKAGTKNGTMVMTTSGANQIHSLTVTAAA